MGCVVWWSVSLVAGGDGEDTRDAAIREAEEEAGLLGVLPRKPLGCYRHINGNGVSRVDVYLMRVTEILERWPEADIRRRQWMRLSEAEACLREELKQFIRAVEDVLGPGA